MDHPRTDSTSAEKGTASLRDLRAAIPTPPDGIVSRTIFVDDDVRVVLFSFAAGQQLSDHTASVPALIEVVDGEASIGIDAQVIDARPGTWLHLPAHTPHSVMARTPVTLLLTMLKAHRTDRPVEAAQADHRDG